MFRGILIALWLTSPARADVSYYDDPECGDAASYGDDCVACEDSRDACKEAYAGASLACADASVSIFCGVDDGGGCSTAGDPARHMGLAFGILLVAGLAGRAVRRA